MVGALGGEGTVLIQSYAEAHRGSKHRETCLPTESTSPSPHNLKAPSPSEPPLDLMPIPTVAKKWEINDETDTRCRSGDSASAKLCLLTV